MSFESGEFKAFSEWLDRNGPVESIQAVICDLNGIMRGKRLPVDQAPRVLG
ncbi:MAG: glutamine synthetase, partial [Mesorhizobium sp.]